MALRSDASICDSAQGIPSKSSSDSGCDMKEDKRMSATKKHMGLLWLGIFALALLVLVGGSLVLAVQATQADGLPLPPRPDPVSPPPGPDTGPSRPVAGFCCKRRVEAIRVNGWTSNGRIAWEYGTRSRVGTGD